MLTYVFDVLQAEAAKGAQGLRVLDWGVSNATLEEVFVKITTDAGARVTAFC